MIKKSFTWLFMGANLAFLSLYTINPSFAYNQADYDKALLCSKFNNGTGGSPSDCNLNGASLNSASLFAANLNGANLSAADLNGANISSANLNNANLSSANLSDANLIFTNFYLTNLSNANLSNANLYSATLTNALNTTPEQISRAYALSYITLPDGTQPSFCSGTQTVSGAFGSQSDFPYVQNYSDCNFSISATAGQTITLNFSSFSIATGSLSVYDGSNTSAALLATFTGTTSNSVTSTGNNMFVRFTNVFTPSTPGFQANYTTNDIPSTPEPSALFGLVAVGLLGLYQKKHKRG